MRVPAAHKLTPTCLSLALSGVLAGCAPPLDVEPGLAQAQPVAGLGQSAYSSGPLAANYMLRPADVIDLVVFREPELSLDSVAISADGEVSLPLLGQVTIAGLTPDQAEEEIERLLGARYLREPDVSINIVQYKSHLVTVEGAVKTPGLYEFQPGTRLSGGLALASGLDRVAALDEVAIFRQSSEGTQIARFDYKAVRSGEMIDPLLEPGDRIIVGTDGLSQFWQDMIRAIPAFGVFTNI